MFYGLKDGIRLWNKYTKSINQIRDMDLFIRVKRAMYGFLKAHIQTEQNLHNLSVALRPPTRMCRLSNIILCYHERNAIRCLSRVVMVSIFAMNRSNYSSLYLLRIWGLCKHTFWLSKSDCIGGISGKKDKMVNIKNGPRCGQTLLWFNIY